MYFLLDVFSRYVTRWIGRLSRRRRARQAASGRTPRNDTSSPVDFAARDRGTSMSSKPVAFLLADLGVTKTHLRPTSRTTIRTGKPFPHPKSRPESRPIRVHSDRRALCQGFFRWYDGEHRHSGLDCLRGDGHYGQAQTCPATPEVADVASNFMRALRTKRSRLAGSSQRSFDSPPPLEPLTAAIDLKCDMRLKKDKAGILWVDRVGDGRSQAILARHFLVENPTHENSLIFTNTCSQSR